MPWPPPVRYVLPAPHRYSVPTLESFDCGGPRRPSRAARIVAMAVIVVVPIMVASASLVLHVAADDRPCAPVCPVVPEPVDPRVTTIAEFVASERGLSFKHPVNVDFLTAEQYHDAVLADHSPAPAGDQTGDSGSGMTDDDVVAQFERSGSSRASPIWARPATRWPTRGPSLSIRLTTSAFEFAAPS